jgi:hypothetical protein
VILQRVSTPPFGADTAASQRRRQAAVARFLDWLEQQPGSCWQQRWLAGAIARAPQDDWRPAVVEWLAGTGRAGALGREGLTKSVTSGLGQLIYADVIRPSMEWLTTSPIRFPLGREVSRQRDPHGFASLVERADAAGLSFDQRRHAVEQAAVIVAAKGGTLADITVGDCLDLLHLRDLGKAEGRGHPGSGFYQLLHAIGVFPPDAPTTLRMLDRRFPGQLSVEELVDQYALACRPVRDLLVAYLAERRPRLDYASLKQLAYHLAKLFWKDLEVHHPGIDSLRLPPDVATAWKNRIATKAVPTRTADGTTTTRTAPRQDALSCLTTVRAFYLDVSSEEPERWAAWAVPCPIRRTDVGSAKDSARRKSRMDQRTRERVPHLPALRSRLHEQRGRATALLAAASATPLGEQFTHDGTVLRRARTTTLDFRRFGDLGLGFMRWRPARRG